MQVIEFYRGVRGNTNGHMLDDILSWSNDALEIEHDYVQWLFPSNVSSNFNCDAPVLTKEESLIFQSDPELRLKLQKSLFRFIDFLDFKPNWDDEVLIFVQKHSDKIPWWLNSFNHNMLRVTRVLKSLRLNGLTEYANILFDTLSFYRKKVSANTWDYWEEAMHGPLW